MRPAPPRAQSLRTAVSFVVVAGLAVVCAILPGAEIVGLTALMIGALSFVVRLRSRAGSFDPFEIIIPAGMLYITYFGGGAIYLTYSPDRAISMPLRPYILPALALATVGFFVMLCGYYLVGTRTRPSPLGRLTQVHPVVSVMTGTVGAIGIAAHTVQTRLVSSGAGISPGISALQQFGMFFIFGWFLVWYEWSYGRTRGPAAIGAFAILIVEAMGVLYVTLGTKSLAIAILLIPCMAIYEARRRLPLKSMAAITLVSIFIVFPLFNAFRLQKRHSGTNVRVAATWELASSWNSDTYLNSSIFAFFKRMSIISSVAAIVADTGTVVPYAKGDTLILAPIALLIPRFVWPDKPNISIGREFGQRFRLVNYFDYESEVAPSLLGEFYWNFGIPCVIVGMFLIGAGYRWYYERYGRGVHYDPVRKAIYATMLLTALGFEGNFAMVVGGSIKLLILIIGFVVLMRHLGLCTPSRGTTAAS